jgi:hypothetical protein
LSGQSERWGRIPPYTTPPPKTLEKPYFFLLVTSQIWLKKREVTSKISPPSAKKKDPQRSPDFTLYRFNLVHVGLDGGYFLREAITGDGARFVRE